MFNKRTDSKHAPGKALSVYTACSASTFIFYFLFFNLITNKPHSEEPPVHKPDESFHQTPGLLNIYTDSAAVRMLPCREKTHL